VVFTYHAKMHHLNINIEYFEKNATIILGKINRIINADERIALIGPNGSGKSTFMQIVSGQILDFHGSIENVGNMTLGYLEQIQLADESQTIREELKDAFSEIRTLEAFITQEEENMAKNPEYDQYEKYVDAIEQYKLLG